MDRKTQELLSSSGWQNYMIKGYLYKQLSGMVRVFQGRYSSYITAEQMAEELETIKKLIDNIEIKFINPSTSLLVQTQTNNKNNTTNINSGGLNNQQKQKKQNNGRVANDINRCHARVWGDSNHLIYRLADGRTVYGYQCKRTKSEGSQYCAKHNRKLTHEDWFAEPSDTMRRHFIKGSKQQLT